ncbi:hypothetical protein H2203_002291 [Taxawa tesnikishii (nom. ined.)]|nr:hypothetical protein H2203_002291 [Dothideales sp. JES 119]
MRSPFSPLQLLTRSSWDSLNVAHQLLGRITTLLFALHTAFYLNFFVRAHVLGKRIRDRDVILGLIGITAFTLVGTTALSWVRKRNYRIFYVVHVVLATLLLPVLYWHVHHIRLYILETLAVYIINTVFRVFATRTVSGTIELVPDTNLLEIKIPVNEAGKAGVNGTWTWQPGQHVYLSLPSHALTRTFRSNPFTIASLPSIDGHLTLVTRVLDGNTKTLALHSSSPSSSPKKMSLEGPYGLSTHSLNLLGFNKVLFVAGGVGATFVVPLYRRLLSDLSPSAGSVRRQRVRLVWAVGSLGEAAWAVPGGVGEGSAEKAGKEVRDESMEKERHAFLERCEIFVTRGDGISASISSPANARGYLKTKNSGISAKDEDDEDGVEMQSLLPSSSEPAIDAVSDSQFHYGRPDLRQVVDETLPVSLQRNGWPWLCVDRRG